MDQKREQQKKQVKPLTKKIVRLQDVIRRKYRNFKRGIVESEQLLKNQYKPLIKELKKVSINDSVIDVKKEIKEEEKGFNPDGYEDGPGSFEPGTSSSPHSPHNFSSKTVAPLEDYDLFETSDDEVSNIEDVSSVVSTSKGLESASRFIDDRFSNPLTKNYMLKLMKDMGGANQKIDHKFGPRYENDTLMVGNKKLEFEDDGSIRIDRVSYAPTEGLYELLFKRIPDDTIYNNKDLSAYKDILLKTSAHKKGYNYKGNIVRDNSTKYKTVIAQLFPKSLYRGKGSVTPQLRGTKQLSDFVDITYWDDPNELCDRLRLLVTSAETGNTNHKNEILSIVEELTEAKAILGRGNAKFQSLVK